MVPPHASDLSGALVAPEWYAAGLPPRRRFEADSCEEPIPLEEPPQPRLGKLVDERIMPINQTNLPNLPTLKKDPDPPLPSLIPEDLPLRPLSDSHAN